MVIVSVTMPAHGRCGSARKRMDSYKSSHGSAANQHVDATVEEQQQRRQHMLQEQSHERVLLEHRQRTPPQHRQCQPQLHRFQRLSLQL
mmetsp:Transcript_131223/g.261879  ORF Transcript_131223/g.261879 Transcript_131223/m.261879 type:complete len:89 (+) Transcript_131223:118-384(+)